MSGTQMDADLVKVNTMMPRSASDLPYDRASDLWAKALSIRLHALNIMDQETAEKLRRYAEELEAQAARLDDV